MLAFSMHNINFLLYFYKIAAKSDAALEILRI